LRAQLAAGLTSDVVDCTAAQAAAATLLASEVGERTKAAIGERQKFSALLGLSMLN